MTFIKNLSISALNFVQRLSCIATLTAKFVQQVVGTDAKILDTRKAIPGWRILEKYAVACGGGTNHRIGLYDQVMIKDNHLVAMGGDIRKAVQSARENSPNLIIEVEADTVKQAETAADAGADIILLDNMSENDLIEAVKYRSGSIQFEASGGINLKTIHNVAKTGVDFISVGALTHSALSVDLSLELES